MPATINSTTVGANAAVDRTDRVGDATTAPCGELLVDRTNVIPCGGHRGVTVIGSPAFLKHDRATDGVVFGEDGKVVSPVRPAAALCVEPILTAHKGLALDPRNLDPEGYSYFKRQQACLWTSEEIDTAGDVNDYRKLSPPEQAFVKQILAFFASADLVVLDNLLEQFGAEVGAYDLKLFFVVQAYIEAVHSETYSNLLTAIVKDPAEQHRLFDAVNTFPSIQKKIDWMQYWTDSESRTFAERLIAFAAVEGVFFSGAFCAVFWLKKRGLLPGLSFANELISRDEGLHRDFAVYVNNKRLHCPAPPATVRRIVESAVQIETDFITNALPVALIGMNAKQMTLYIEFVADHLLVSLRQPKLYHAKNPFDWMDMISLQGKTNFFEKRVGEYSLSGVASAEPKHEFDLDTSF